MLRLLKRTTATENELNRRNRSICTNLDEGTVRVGIRMTDLTVENYAALMLKHSQRDIYTVPDHANVDFFSTSKFDVHTYLTPFPTGLVQV